MFALNAIGLITEFLPLVVRDGSNIEFRSAMAWASTQAGFVESLSFLISHHSLEHAISGYHPNVAHGAGLTATSVSYFTCLAERNVSRLTDVAQKMGEKVDGLPEGERPLAFVAALEKLIKKSGLEMVTLESLGVKKEEADVLAQHSIDSGGFGYLFTPVKLDKEDVMKIIRSCFES